MGLHCRQRCVRCYSTPILTILSERRVIINVALINGSAEVLSVRSGTLKRGNRSLRAASFCIALFRNMEAIQCRVNLRESWILMCDDYRSVMRSFFSCTLLAEKMPFCTQDKDY